MFNHSETLTEMAVGVIEVRVEGRDGHTLMGYFTPDALYRIRDLFTNRYIVDPMDQDKEEGSDPRVYRTLAQSEWVLPEDGSAMYLLFKTKVVDHGVNQT